MFKKSRVRQHSIFKTPPAFCQSSINRPVLAKPTYVIRWTHFRRGVVVLRPEDGVEKCGGLIQGQVFPGKKHKHFRESLAIEALVPHKSEPIFRWQLSDTF